VLGELAKQAEKAPDDYETFWDNFGAVLKEGLYEDQERRGELLALARFASTADVKPTSLEGYLGRMKEGQDAIYYITGDEIEARHWDAFYEFYMATADRKWGRPYLTREFFHLLGERLGERVVLIMADFEDQLVAGALNLRSDTTLYGRNWGCLARFKFLHFETCYYQAIDYAIAQGLASVEAGAQGEHKIQRGYLPTPVHSLHWIADPNFSSAVEEFLARERRAIEQEIAYLDEHSPFRQDCAAS